MSRRLVPLVLPPAEVLNVERLRLVLRELGFEARELDGSLPEQTLAIAREVRQEGHRYQPTWHVDGAEVYAYDPNKELSPERLMCTCSRRMRCAHVAAVVAALAWSDPNRRHLFTAPAWELALGPLLDVGLEADAPPPHRGWVRYHLRPPELLHRLPMGLRLEPEVIRLARDGRTELKPMRYPRTLDKLRRTIQPLQDHDAEVHRVWSDLEQARSLVKRRGGRPEEGLLVHLARSLLVPLSICHDVRFEGDPVAVSTEPLHPQLVGETAQGGLSLRWEPAIRVLWPEGFALTAEGTLHALAEDLPEEVRLRLDLPLPVVPTNDVDRFVDRALVQAGLQVQLPEGVGRVRKADTRVGRIEVAEQGADLVLSLAYAYARRGAVGVTRPSSGGTAVRIPGVGLALRDAAWEREELRRFVDEVGGPSPIELRGDDALDFLTERLPGLSRRWEVFGQDALVRFRTQAALVPAVSFESGVDWFDLDVRFEVKGQRVPTRDVLNSWLEGRRYHRLRDGTISRLPFAWLERHGAVADELTEVRRLSKRLGAHAAWMASELLADTQGAERWAELAAQLAAVRGIPERPVPEGLLATLRPYQVEGYTWLCFLRDHGLGGCLADDMGLGKTVQTLAALLDTHGQDGPPSLVVAPTSVLPNWVAEARRFAPSLRVALHHGSKRTADFEGVDLVITSYALLRIDQEVLGAQPWRWAILDEAQAIKNPASSVARAARSLRASHRLVLTGTPIENHLVDLWSLFAYALPGFFGSRRSFHARYAAPAQKDPDAASLGELRQRVRPFLLRRLKEEVARELPPRQQVIVRCALSPEEWALYRQVRETYRASVKERRRGDDVGHVRLHILEALTRLRQACCHPQLLPFPEAQELHHSTKVEMAVRMLVEATEEGHKALVFSQWPSLLRRVAARLDEVDLRYLYLDGATTERGALVERFHDADGPPVFLISLKAGGTGLNLTPADHVLHLDPWWNPAAEDQATDRAHRIGQSRPVMVYRFVAEGTVEERIVELQELKRGLTERAIEGASVKSWSLGELEALI